MLDLKCRCGATCTIRGYCEDDVNAVHISDRVEFEWEGGDESCSHEEYEVVGEWEPEFDDW